MLEGHGRMDLPCVHGHPVAWVRKGWALGLPVMVARGHVTSCWATIHPVLVTWRVGARRDVTGQSRGRLQVEKSDVGRGVGVGDDKCE